MAKPLGSPKVGGRKKGTPNKSTSELRETFNTLINNNLDNIQEWLEKCAKRNPGKALDVLTRMAELIMPKPIAEADQPKQNDWYAEKAKELMKKVV